MLILNIMVNRIKYISFSIVLFLTLISCQNQLNAKDYILWFSNPENGLRKDQFVKKFELSLMYQSSEFTKAKQITINNYQSNLKSNLNKTEIFQFRIKLLKGSNILRLNQNEILNESTRINHYSFKAKNDFLIITKNDTLRCQLCHFSRNYNLTPTIDLTLVFDELDKESDWKIIYKDSQFGIGTVKFLIKNKDIKSIPVLKV